MAANGNSNSLQALENLSSVKKTSLNMVHGPFWVHIWLPSLSPVPRGGGGWACEWVQRLFSVMLPLHMPWLMGCTGSRYKHTPVTIFQRNLWISGSTTQTTSWKDVSARNALSTSTCSLFFISVLIKNHSNSQNKGQTPTMRPFKHTEACYVDAE